MALEIKSGATSDVLTVDATSKAARVTLYDALGNEIAQANHTNVSTTQEVLPSPVSTTRPCELFALRPTVRNASTMTRCSYTTHAKAPRSIRESGSRQRRR